MHWFCLKSNYAVMLPLSSVIVYSIMPFTYRDLQQSLQHPVRGFPNIYRGQPYVAIAYRQKYIASVTSVSSVYIQIEYKGITLNGLCPFVYICGIPTVKSVKCAHSCTPSYNILSTHLQLNHFIYLAKYNILLNMHNTMYISVNS